MKKQGRKLLIILAGWTAFALFMLAQSFAYRMRVGQSIELAPLFFREFSYAYVWAALTPVVLWLARRFAIERHAWKRNVAVHVFASLLVSVTHKVVSGGLDGLYAITRGVTFSWETQFQGVLAYFDYGILLYWIILLMKYSLDYYRRYRETELRTSQLQAQLAQAQLQALKMQLHPHFLFNTLNAISVLIGKDPAIARKTLGHLSDLLRMTLDNSGVQEVPLRMELEFLDRYLQIERTRFGDRLTVTFDIPPEVLDILVPNMILQPIVENAIKHGINEQRGPGRIEISAVKSNGSLQLQVRDNGRGLRTNGATHTGVGLANVRARLQELYPDEYRLELSDNPGGGVETLLVFPVRSGSDKSPES